MTNLTPEEIIEKFVERFLSLPEEKQNAVLAYLQARQMPPAGKRKSAT